MFDYVAYLLAQQQTRDRAGEALPDAPARAEPAVSEREPRLAGLRSQVSLGLRRLADAIDPCRELPKPAESRQR